GGGANCPARAAPRGFDAPARAWRANAGRFEVGHPGDYANFNSYQPRDGTVLTTVPLFAETLTARQMLAQVQNQAATLLGGAKKPTATEVAKLETGKTDLDKAEPVKTAD